MAARTRTSVLIELAPSHAGERGRLQHTQQPDLELERHLRDLVEEQRPPVGALEVPLVQPIGAGEAAALVAEQLAFDQVRGDGAAVHGQERFLAAAAQGVDGQGDHVLAGAGLAGDQDAGVGAGHAADQVVDGLHGRRRADQRSEAPQLAQLASQRSDLALHPQRAGHVGQGHLDAGKVDGLRQVVDGAPSKGVHRGLDARVSRDQDDLGGRGGLERVQEVEPAAVGQVKVDEQDVGRARRDFLAGLLQGAGARHREALAPDQLGQPEQEPRVVVDDQRAGRGRCLRSCVERGDVSSIHV